VSVVFSWSWSHRPLWEGTDSVACSFRGVNGSNQDVGVMRAASGCTVRYVSDETAGDRVSTAYELESGGYDIPQAMQAGAETYWAESGSFSITVREIVEVNELEEVVFVFGYNHMGSDNRERVLALSESSSQQMIPMCSFRYVAGLSG